MSQFRVRLEEAFGPASATVFAQDHVLTHLGNRTVNQALAAGVPAKEVWRVVWTEMELPARLR